MRLYKGVCNMSEAVASTPTVEASSPVEGASEPVAQETKPLTAAQKEKFQYVIDGEQVEEEIDFSDKESLKKRLQISHAAEKRLHEARALKNKLGEAYAQATDPKAFLKSLGPKAREVVEKYLLDEIQNDMKSPEEKEYEMTKAELAQYKEKEKLAKENEEKQKASAQEAKYAQEFQTTIIGALDKCGLPKTPDLVKRMAYIMSKNLELGLDLSPDELAHEVRQEQQGILQSISKDASAEQILAILGPDVANKIRKYDLEKLKLKRNPVQSPDRPEVFENSERKNKGNMSMDEWRAQVEARIRNG